MSLRRLLALFPLFVLLALPPLTAVAQDDDDEEVEEEPVAAAVETDDDATEDDAEKADDEDEEDDDPVNAALLRSFRFRGIGPALTSGRIGDFAFDPRDHDHFYAAVCSGGVWETTNGGMTWSPIFDSAGSYSIGCIEIDPDNPNVLWVGTGENNSQRSVSFGDGVYKSTDGGRSWNNVGLKESEHIGMIAIDPRDSDVVYVAAQGPLWNAGGDRGLYKTTDGGTTWEKILDVSEHTGVSEVRFDPRDPDVLYASSYQRRRRVWTLINGGPESGMWKSTDAGATWHKINRGLPGGDKGRIGFDISPVDPDVLYAIVEAANGGGIYRSTNRGASWSKRSSYMTSSPQYYNELFCDPHDVDTIYTLDTVSRVSRDGGATMESLSRRARHVDDHALWIDPNDPTHLWIGGDGGIYESHNGGRDWRYCPNLPVTQFYRVAVDNARPFYTIYGGTQDNNTLGGPSRTRNRDGILNEDWFVTVGGDGFETVVDPDNPDIVYSQWQHGGLVRFDRRSGEALDIKPREKPGEDPYVWNWDSPLRISPHQGTRLYFGADRLFRSDDRGDSWRAISGNLTRQVDRNQLEVMGTIQKPDAVSKHRSTSIYGNLVALSESPIVEGLIYTGSDDGLISVTEDGGATWRDAGAIEGLPELIYVSWLSAGKHDADTVYAAFDDHKSGNFAPLVYRSTDRGRTWESIASDLPDRHIVYAVAEDHVNPDLLFVGTEFGVHVTLDGGATWFRFSAGLPPIAIRDIEIQERENDLVLASFGRGFFVLDDYAPLRELDAETLTAAPATIFATRPALAYVTVSRGRGSQGVTQYSASNPPFGATFTYYVAEKTPLTLKEERSKRERDRKKADEPYEYPTTETIRAEERERAPSMELVIRDGDGAVVRRLRASRSKGLHRTTWDLRWSGWEGSRSGPRAIPGTYTVELVQNVDGELTRLTEPSAFKVNGLNLATLPARDRDEVLAFQHDVARLQRTVAAANREFSRMRERLDYARTALGNLPDPDDALRVRIRELERTYDELTVTMNGDRTASSRFEPTSPSINGRIGTVVGGIWNTSSAPTQTHRDQYEYASAAFTRALQTMRDLDAAITEIEDELLDLGAPWVPQRLPSWP